MLGVGDADQRRAEERPARQVEAVLRGFGRQAAGLRPPLVLRQVPQVGDRQVEVGRGRGDPLHGDAVHGRERRAQRLVAAHQLGERAAERVVRPARR